MKTVEERMQGLETRLRRYQRLTVLIGLVLVALVTISATPSIPDVIRAREFRVVNPKGITVASLRSWKLGGWLEIRNNKGKITTLMAQDDRGSGSMTIRTEKSKKVIKMGVDDLYNGYLEIRSKEGKELIVLAATINLNGSIEINNRKGKQLFFVGQGENDGDGLLKVYSKNHKGEVQLNFTDSGGQLLVVNKTGEEVVQLFSDEYGNGVVGVWNREGKGRTFKPGP